MPRTAAKPITVSDLTEQQKAMYDLLSEDLRPGFLASLKRTATAAVSQANPEVRAKAKAPKIEQHLSLVAALIEALGNHQTSVQEAKEKAESGELVNLKEVLDLPEVQGFKLMQVRGPRRSKEEIEAEKAAKAARQAASGGKGRGRRKKTPDAQAAAA